VRSFNARGLPDRRDVTAALIGGAQLLHANVRLIVSCRRCIDGYLLTHSVIVVGYFELIRRPAEIQTRQAVRLTSGVFCCILNELCYESMVAIKRS